MPSQETNHAHKGRKKINPATSSVEELLAHLSVDPAVGLSQKEAGRRKEKSDAAPLFNTPRPRFSSLIKRLIGDPALWLLLAVGVISLFFDRVAIGLLCIALGGGNVLLSAWFLYFSTGTDASARAYDAPLARVRRGRRISRVVAENVVRGDIILLRKGDIVPADCRLLLTDRFTVTERLLDATDPTSPTVRLIKEAKAEAETDGDYRHSPVNMAFAGGMVEEGKATAVVVAVGSETHMGAFSGQIRPAHPSRNPSLFSKVSQYLSVYNVCMLCLIIPITAIGIVTLGDRYEFLDIFLAAVTLAAVTLSSHLLARGTFVSATIRQKAASGRKNTAYVKTDYAMEKLSAVNDLLLVGTAALHDGECHPESLFVGDTVYNCETERSEADSVFNTVVNLLCLYNRHAPLGEQGESREGVPVAALTSALVALVEPDLETFCLRIQDIRRETDGVSGIFPTAEGNRRERITVTPDHNVAAACSLIHRGTHEAPMTDEDRATLYRNQREAVLTGYRVCYILVHAGGQSVLRGMLTYAPHTCRKTAGVIRSMETAGIRVTSFQREISEENTRILAECGLTNTHPAHRPDGGERPPAIQLVKEGYRAFEGCDDAYVRAYVSALKAEGRTVAVLTADGRDLSLTLEADLVLTCAPELGAADTPVGEDGLPDGACANDLLRRRADVVIQRTATTGGGIMGVRRALLAADHFKITLRRITGYLFVSQAARILTVLVPLIFGLSLTTAPTLLLSGVIMDFWVTVCYTGVPLPDVPAADRGSSVLPRPWSTHFAMLVGAAVAVTFSWLIVGIARIMSVDLGADVSYYSFLCLFGLQIAFFRSVPLPKRNSRIFLSTMGMAILYVAALGAALAVGLNAFWALILPLLSPAVYSILFALVSVIRGVRAARRTVPEAQDAP